MIHNDLYSFIVLTEEMNFTKAADRLFIAQQTLSEQIKKLEKRYDAVYFERKPVLKLTPEGERMLIYAKKIIEEENKLIADLNKLKKKNSLVIGCSGAIGSHVLSDSLPELTDLYTDGEVSLILSSAQNLMRMLRNGDIDAYIVCAKDLPDEFRCEVIYKTSFKYYCKKDLFEKYYDVSAFSRLSYDEQVRIIAKVPFSTVPLNYPLRNTLDSFFALHGLTPNYVSSATSAEMNAEICRNSRAGTVIESNLADKYIPQAAADEFVSIQLPDMPELEPLSFITKKDSTLPEEERITQILKKHIPKKKQDPA